MALLSQIDDNLNKALRDKNELTLSTLRLLKSEIKNTTIAKGSELNDEEIITIIQKGIKQRQEAITQYQSANRPDLASKEQKELDILKPYLPKQLSDDELKNMINETKIQLNASSPQDFGNIMGILMPKIKGRADGNRIANLVRESLNGS